MGYNLHRMDDFCNCQVLKKNSQKQELLLNIHKAELCFAVSIKPPSASFGNNEGQTIFNVICKKKHGRCQCFWHASTEFRTVCSLYDIVLHAILYSSYFIVYHNFWNTNKSVCRVRQATIISANFAFIAVTLNYRAKIQENTLAAGGLL